MMTSIIVMDGNDLKDDVNNTTSFLRGVRSRFACVWVCTTEISIVLNTRTVETAIKHFVLIFVRPSHFEAYIVMFFALVWCLVLCHSGRFHHENKSVYRTPPYTPILYSKTGVYRGIHFFLIFALKHRLWVLVRTASLRRFVRTASLRRF